MAKYICHKAIEIYLIKAIRRTIVWLPIVTFTKYIPDATDSSGAQMNPLLDFFAISLSPLLRGTSDADLSAEQGVAIKFPRKS